MRAISPGPILTEQVRDAIIDAIVEGSLRTGERLAQEDIARRLGVSRQPVSHALNVLKEQGVLVELGRKGLTVAPMEASRLRDLYVVRASLDALAARSAAERMAAGRIDVSDITPLEKLLNEHRSTLPRGEDVARWVDADVSFHAALYRLSGNPWLEEMTRPHWVHFRRCMHSVLEDSGLRGAVWPEHAEIVEAVLAGDPARAGTLAEQHAHRAGVETAARLSALGRNLEESL